MFRAFHAEFVIFGTPENAELMINELTADLQRNRFGFSDVAQVGNIKLKNAYWVCEKDLNFGKKFKFKTSTNSRLGLIVQGSVYETNSFWSLRS